MNNGKEGSLGRDGESPRDYHQEVRNSKSDANITENYAQVIALIREAIMVYMFDPYFLYSLYSMRVHGQDRMIRPFTPDLEGAISDAKWLLAIFGSYDITRGFKDRPINPQFLVQKEEEKQAMLTKIREHLLKLEALQGREFTYLQMPPDPWS